MNPQGSNICIKLYFRPHGIVLNWTTTLYVYVYVSELLETQQAIFYAPPFPSPIEALPLPT